MPWIKFDLIKKPFWDRDGNILTSIEGRRNRKGIDEFTGGGRVYPDIDRTKVEEWHQKDDVLLVKIDITEVEATTITTKKEFKALILTDQEADAMKKDFFGIVESGVII